jgi:predicted O-methyltransferase YrrM
VAVWLDYSAAFSFNLQAMSDLAALIQLYAEQHTQNEPDHLYALNRYTHLNVLKPRMLSGPIQGRFLALLSQLMQAQYVLDIGTFTGYSALCLAEGLAKNGIVHSIDNICHLGEAKSSIASLNESVPFWDMVWIDAHKADYAEYYDLCFDKVKPGGLILADNVLWDGKVVDAEALQNDKDTKALHSFNQKIKSDNRVQPLLLPIRDGILIMRKR